VGNLWLGDAVVAADVRRTSENATFIIHLYHIKMADISFM